MDLSIITNNWEVISPVVGLVLVKVLPPQYTIPVKFLIDFIGKLRDSKSLSMEQHDIVKEKLMDEAIEKVATVADKNLVGVTVKPEDIATIVTIAKESKGFKHLEKESNDFIDKILGK